MNEWMGTTILWKLLYRASQDGGINKDFHWLCVNVGATVTLIKTKSGAIFGGYTSKSWTADSEEVVEDTDAFLFSVTDGLGRAPEKLPVKQDQTK